MTVHDELTEVLCLVANGDRPAIDYLIPMVYDQVHSIAARHMEYERRNHTLDPAAVVNEVYARLVSERQVVWQNRDQFFAVIARCVKQVLLNHARGHHAKKRGGYASRLTLSDHSADISRSRTIDATDLCDALCALRVLEPRHAMVVEFRFFGGLSVRAVAGLLGVSERTVESDWQFARAWLRARHAPPRVISTQREHRTTARSARPGEVRRPTGSHSRGSSRVPFPRARRVQAGTGPHDRERGPKRVNGLEPSTFSLGS